MAFLPLSVGLRPTTQRPYIFFTKLQSAINAFLGKVRYLDRRSSKARSKTRCLDQRLK